MKPKYPELVAALEASTGQRRGQCAECGRPHWSRAGKPLCPPCDPTIPHIERDEISNLGWHEYERRRALRQQVESQHWLEANDQFELVHVHVVDDEL